MKFRLIIYKKTGGPRVHMGGNSWLSKTDDDTSKRVQFNPSEDTLKLLAGLSRIRIQINNNQI